ncbi:unnamed protein product [Candidula unifasciata]|uniref:G-protein coupled receptors family 1 profile domain-containing protein n=1 Tax=Candidula unifasciata TaxID=100452 RepID=A0A8S3ZBK4_9EUPU|nr:unnamed protein product [Candidula unifasciata]
MTTTFSAACPSSSTQACLALKSNYQDPAVLQDGHVSTTSSEPTYNMTPKNLQYNSTTMYTFYDQVLAEARRLYGFITKVNWYTIVVLYPCIGVVGLVANILSAFILIRSGLGKPSNIFLLAIALADSLCLLGAANIAYILMHFPKTFPFGVFLWQYSISESLACYVFGVAFRCLSVYGIYVSAALCMVVTTERLIAVYLPLHFINIVTPFRAWLVCFGCFAIWLPYLIFTGIMWYRFDYRFYNQWNAYGGEMTFKGSEMINVLLDYYVGSIFGKFIPLAVVIAGSVLIAIKVSITLRKRRKMVAASGKPSSSGSRTTTTLLVVCLTFVITKIIVLPSYFYTPTTDIQLLMFWNFYGAVINIAEYVNGFCNFFIYVFLNKKFRVVFLSIFSRKKR